MRNTALNMVLSLLILLVGLIPNAVQTEICPSLSPSHLPLSVQVVHCQGVHIHIVPYGTLSPRCLSCCPRNTSANTQIDWGFRSRTLNETLCEMETKYPRCSLCFGYIVEGVYTCRVSERHSTEHWVFVNRTSRQQVPSHYNELITLDDDSNIDWNQTLPGNIMGQSMRNRTVAIKYTAATHGKSIVTLATCRFKPLYDALRLYFFPNTSIVQHRCKLLRKGVKLSVSWDPSSPSLRLRLHVSAGHRFSLLTMSSDKDDAAPNVNKSCRIVEQPRLPWSQLWICIMGLVILAILTVLIKICFSEIRHFIRFHLPSSKQSPK